MKFIKKVFIAALTLIFATTGLFAQEEMKPELKKRANHRIEKTAEKLGLSDDQKTAFTEIQTAYAEKAKAIKAQTDSREELADLIYANRKAKTAEIKELLTPEQYATFDKVGKKGKGKGKKGKKGKRNKQEKKKQRM